MRSDRRATVLTFAAITLLVLVALLALAWWAQERILFQPPPVRAEVAAAVQQLRFAGRDGTPLLAYVVRAPRAAPSDTAPLVVHFHGNAEIAAWVLPWAEELAERTGATVVLAEYRGYGGIPGRPTYTASAEDADALWDAMQRELGASPARTIVHGFSLGSAVATELAARMHPRALVLEAPFTSASDMAARMGPLLRGPLWRLISRIHFDTRALVASLEAPVHVAHGSSDRIIPAGMGRAVHAAARRPGHLVLVPGAGHNDLRANPAYWEWITAVVAAPGGGG